MISIETDDRPITVAEKLITAEMPVKNPITGKEIMVDAYELEELEEIADYLKVYVKSHSKEE